MVAVTMSSMAVVFSHLSQKKKRPAWAGVVWG